MPAPTKEEHRRFLISFLFAGNMNPGLPECVGRAYRDFSRTAHGITKVARGSIVKAASHRLVEKLLVEAAAHPDPWAVSSFDKWHARACGQICKHYAECGYPDFRIGHAQKWLNMSIKYALTLAAIGMVSIADSENVRTVAHVPLDEYMLKSFADYDAPLLASTWSKITDYNAYIEFQRWIRDRFPGSNPLDVEFHLYNDEVALRRRERSDT